MKIADLIGALTRPDDAVADALAPLAEAWADPGVYRAALAEHVARWGLGRLRSQPETAVDPYADAVGRFVRSPAPALVWYDADRGWSSMARARLDQLASGLAARWLAQGVEPGAIVAIVFDPGPERLVAMMAALRIGAVLSLLEPRGTARLPARLAALEPDFLAFDVRRPPPVGGCAAPVLASTGDPDERATRSRSQRSLPPPHPYAARAPLGLMFSPVRAAGEQPTPLAAADAVFGALSDGVVAWRLTPGRALAVPGAHPLQYSPCTELAALLCGATQVHIPWPALARRPRLLAEQRIDVLFISEALRDLLQQRPVPLDASHWIRGLDAPLDWPRWRDLIAAVGLDQALASNVLVDAASGGGLLYSVQRPGSLSARAVPAPGRRWSLLDTGAPERASVGSAGVFQTLVTAEDTPEPDPSNPGWCVLGRQGPEFLYGGPRALRRSARLYPSAEVEAALATLDGVEASCAIATVGAGEGWFTVLVFTGAPSTDRTPPTREAIRRHIARAVGPDGRPDAVEVLPLHARRVEGEVDRAWYAAQYQSGRLAARVEDDAHTALTALRAELLDG